MNLFEPANDPETIAEHLPRMHAVLLRVINANSCVTIDNNVMTRRKALLWSKGRKPKRNVSVEAVDALFKRGLLTKCTEGGLSSYIVSSIGAEVCRHIPTFHKPHPLLQRQGAAE